MNAGNVPNNGDEPTELDNETASRFLRLGFAERRSPADELIDRLLQFDDPELFKATIEQSPVADICEPAQLLRGGPLSLEDLKSIKARSKQLLSRATSRDARHSATAAYFLSVATALAYNGCLITSVDKVELGRIMDDLATATPAPWSDVFRRAAEAITRQQPKG